MERKFNLQNLFAILVITSVLGCGYFENDGIIYKKKIIGNIILCQTGSGSEFNLEFSQNPESLFLIIGDCRKVYFDSINKKIYVEARLNQYINQYYKVKVNNSESEESSKAYEVVEINKKIFDTLSSDGKLVKVFP